MKRALGFGLFQASYSTQSMVRVGVAAEKFGFRSVLIGDHFLDLSGLVKVDPWTVLTYIGSRTKKIRLTTHVTDVIRMHPSKVAQVAATLDELTGGRVSIGLGAGESMNIAPFGMDFFDEPAERVARLREGIQVIRALLRSDRGHRVNYQGKYYRLREAWMQQRPVQKRVPIGVGALGARRSLELVGEAGDIWLPAYNTLSLFKERMAVIKQSARNCGRDPDSIEYNAAILGVITKDKRMVKKAIDAYRASILSLAPRLVTRMSRTPRTSIRVDLAYDYQRVIPGAPVVGRTDPVIRRIPDEVVEDFMVIGSAEELVEAIDSYRKAGATDVIFWDMVAEGILDSLPLAFSNMRLIQDKVMPHFL